MKEEWSAELKWLFLFIEYFLCPTLAKHFKYIISNYHNTSDSSCKFSSWSEEKIDSERGWMNFPVPHSEAVAEKGVKT